MLKWNGDEALAAITKETARRMLEAAKALQDEHRKRLGVVNPKPYLQSSHKGEYPKRRKGRLRNGTIVEPTTVSRIASTGRVVVRYSEAAQHGNALTKRGWKGIQDTECEIQAKLKTVLTDAKPVKV